MLIFVLTHLLAEELYTQMGFLFGRFWLIEICIAENGECYHQKALPAPNLILRSFSFIRGVIEV